MDQEKVSLYYDKACRAANTGWQASLWLSAEDQYYRYVLMGQMLNWQGCSVLDIGCGQGDLYQFIKERSKNVTYTGVDISQEMVTAAKRRFPDAEFLHADFLSEDFQPKQYDFVLGIGTFAVKLDGNQMEYFKRSINKLYKIANRAVGITLSSVKSAYDMKFEEFYHYYDPAEVLNICLGVTPSVILNHSTLPLEMAVFLHKE